MNQNLVNAAIPAATVKEVADAIALIATKLNPYLLENITKETLEPLQKLGERSEVFVRRAVEVAEKEPELLPAYLDPKEARADLDLYLQLKELNSMLSMLTLQVASNCSLAGAEALDFANDYYRSIRFLSTNNHPKARQYFEELQERYAKVGRRKKSNPAS